MIEQVIGGRCGVEKGGERRRSLTGGGKLAGAGAGVGVGRSFGEFREWVWV
jgi:hypothetical protein